jgi:hypothetical protein
MPTFDAHKNLAIGQILTAPSPATTGLSLTLRAGQGALFPTAPFNCTVWPASVNPISTNAEIIRVTNVVGDVLTIVRAQEGTTAKSIAVGWQVSNSISVKVITDLETAVNALPAFAIQSISAGTSVATGPQVIFSNSNGVSFGISNNVLTASAVGGGGGGGAAISAGANSQNTGTIVFSNSNGISFGLDGAGVLTASHNALTSQSNQAASASNGSFTFQTLSFTNASNVTFGTSAGGIIFASVNPTVAQSTQPVAASASNGSFLFSTLGFSNANGVTFGTSAGSIVTASIGAGAAPGTISAGANSVALGQVIFSNSNNVSFGLNGSTITASVAAAGGNVSFSAGTSSAGLNSLVFSNSNGISFGLNGSTITAHRGSDSYFVNHHMLYFTQLGSWAQSTSVIFPIYIPNNLTFDFLRLMASGSVVAASTTGATTGNTQFSCGVTKSHNFAIYSRGSGASSYSLQSYYSTQILENYSNNVSAAANSTQFSYSNRYSFPCSTGISGFTQDYSSSAASLNFHSTNVATAFTANKQVDFKFGTTLSAGQWWLMYGMSSTSSSQFTSLGFRNQVNLSFQGVTGNSLQYGVLGAAASGTVNAQWGAGSFTTAGGSTTGSLNFTNISTALVNNQLYVQLMVTS